MKKISDKEFRDYMEYKNFMGEEPGMAEKPAMRRLDLQELDQVRAASGNRDFARFLKEMQDRNQEEK